MQSDCNIIIFGDEDFTVYFGLVYNDIINLTMTINYLTLTILDIHVQMFTVMMSHW